MKSPRFINRFLYAVVFTAISLIPLFQFPSNSVTKRVIQEPVESLVGDDTDVSITNSLSWTGGVPKLGTIAVHDVHLEAGNSAFTTDFIPDVTTANAGWQEVGVGSASGGGISDNNGLSALPSMSVAPDGTPYVAWRDRSGGIDQIYIRRWDGSSWEPVGAGSASGGGISDNSSESQDPSMAISPDGTPYVAWADIGGLLYWQIYARWWDGGSWEPVGAGSASGAGLSNTDSDSLRPSMAIAPDGTPYIAWDEGWYAFWIYVRRWNGSVWQAVGGEISGDNGESMHPSLAVAPDNTPYVAWEDYESVDRNFEIYVRRWNGSIWEELGGSASGGGVSDTDPDSWSPSMAIAPDGTPYVAWTDYNYVDGSWTIYVRRWNGSVWQWVGKEISGNNNKSWMPSMAIAPDGTPYVAWADNSSGVSQIYVRRWNGSVWEPVGAGSADGGGISDTSGGTMYPSMAIAPDGRPYVAWQDWSDADAEIYVRRWNSNCMEDRVYFPLALQQSPGPGPAPPCDASNSFCEDYDTCQNAYGPLEPGVAYRAYPDDGHDFYYLDLSADAEVTVHLNHFVPTSSNGTVVLYGPAVDGNCGPRIDYVGEPGHSSMSLGPHLLKPGKYHVLVYTVKGFSITELYSLIVTY